MFVINLFLAVVWTGLTGDFTIANFLVGFLLGALAIRIVTPVTGARHYAVKLWYAVELVGYFLGQLLIANLRVAHDVLTPTHHMSPGVVAVPLDARTDLEITLLANLITLTPGSLSLDVSDDRSVLYLHVMHLDDIDAYRRQIKQGFEARIMRLLR